MSVPVGFISEPTEDVAFSPDGPTAEPRIAESKNPQCEDRSEITDEEDEEKSMLKEEEEEMTSSAHLEPSTLPWPGDLDKRPQVDNNDGVWSEKGVSEPEERDKGIGGGSQDLSKKQSQVECDGRSKAKWRESMPEGERWRDYDGSQADDEDEEDEEDEEENLYGRETNWMPEKAAALGFTPQVTIVHPTCKKLPEESRLFIDKDVEKEPQVDPDLAAQYCPEWTEPDDKYYLCENVCSVKLRLALATVAAALLFPLLVWGGYELLPFDPPLLESAPLRVVYTLRCSFFACIPILLGVVVQGVARLRHSELKPLYQSKMMSREVAVHWHYINESLALFLFYFLQLAVMATYISQELVKLVPLLTVMFVFGRLIYWLCLSLGSSIRGLGFGFSFFPILVMLGANFYYICSSVGQDAVFDVEPPTTAPPPRQRWWG
ncbi:putative transmembrane protein 79-like isoform 2 [Scophthalmus maximus]|uniref:Putative transmembrane protein 79-like isoform 2 n=1 Tax=Scophthalmus maximus TaxID=52904 RepID=A0A2U9CZR4_SCOMX|nr:transmembrane protein 79 [Scophthalmus maximus]XP_035477141.1 transmembrane protein 79 [Scophthalmus maximus]AWP21540.1 putative transmembrane protein 79-like isoform 2 [Scophthalmus maximus]